VILVIGLKATNFGLLLHSVVLTLNLGITLTSVIQQDYFVMRYFAASPSV
jgi:hypothetical protein